MSKLYFKVASDWQEVVRLRNEISKLETQIKSMDANKAPQAVAVLNNQMQQVKLQMRGMISEAARVGTVMDNDFKSKIYEGSQAINNFTQKIINQKAVIRDIEVDVKRLGESYRSALKNNPLSASGKLPEYTSAKKALDEEKATLFGLTQEQANARLSVKKLRDEYALYRNDAKGMANTTDSIGISLGKALGVIGGVTALKQLGSEIIRVRGEFQSMQTTIETLVGKNMAANLIPQIKELAKVSPLTLSDMVGAEKMMLGFNINAEDTIRYLQALGDISMGDSQKFNSLTLAFSQMSATGKLMGQDLNQMINAGFNPLQQISDTTGKSMATLKNEMSKGAISAEMVQQAFINATSAGGKFFGMSENASKTINGQLSMMQDALDEVFNEIGTKGEGAIMSGIQATTSLIKNYETVGKILSGLVVTYGVYRAALITNIALTHSWAVAARVDAVAKGIQTISTKAQTIAQLALNSAMKANPYVIAATLVVGVASAMWALHDGTTAAEKAQESFNKKVEDATKEAQDHKQKLEGLISELQNEVTAETRKMEILNEIKKGYPSLFQKFIDEKGHVKDLTAAWKAYNEEASKGKAIQNKTNASDLKQSIDDMKRIQEVFTKYGYDFKSYTKNDLSLYQKYKPYEDGDLKENIEKSERELWKWEKEVRDDEFTQWKVDLKSKTDAQIEASRAALVKRAQGANGNKHLLAALGKRIIAIDEEKNVRKANAVTYGSDFDKAKTEWETAKKEFDAIEKDKDKYTRTKYDNAKTRKETAEKAYKDLGGVTGSALAKEESAAEKLRKQQEKYRILIDKQKLDQIRAEEDLQTQVDEAHIKTMEEGSKKTIAQMELNFEKEMQVIDRQKEDALRKKIEEARTAWEANPENKKKSFDATGIKLSDEDIKGYDSLYKSKIEEFEKDKYRMEAQSMRDYLKEYGTFQQQKLAIAEEYAQKIKNAQSKGEILKLEKERDTAILNKETEAIKSKIDWVTVFGEFGGMFNDMIKPTLEEAKKYIKTDEFKNSDQASQKTLIDAINQMEKSLGGTGGLNFKKLGQDVQVYQNALRDLNNATNDETQANERLTKAKETYEKAVKGGTEQEKQVAKDALDIAQLNADAASANVKAQTDIANQSQQDVTNTATGLRASMENVTEGLSKMASGGLKNAFDGVIQASKGISRKFKETADDLKSVPIIGWILSIIDVLKDGLSNLVGSILDAVFNAISGIISDIFSGDLFVTIFKSLRDGIGNILNSISFGGWNTLMGKINGSDEREVNKLVEKLTESNKYLSMAIDKLTGEMEKSGGLKVTEYYEAAREKQKEKTENDRQMLEAKMGYNSAHHSNNYYINEAFSADDWKKASDYIGKQLSSASDLWKLTPEELAKFKEIPDIWEKINSGKYDQSEYLDAYLEDAEKLEELTRKWQETLTQTSFDSLVDSFKSALADMDSSAEDFADDFQKYMMNAIINSFVNGEEFQKRLKGWYTKFSDYVNSEGKLTEGEKNELKEEWDGMVKDGLEYRENIADIMGFKKGSSSQQATNGGFQTMSQDTGSELNGRFTALQIAGEEIKNQSIQQTGLLSSINEKMSLLDLTNKDIPALTSGIPNIADQTRESIVNSYQPQINVIFPDAKIDILTAEVSTLKDIVNEMRTFQVDGNLDRQEIREGIQIISKNSPKILNNTDSMKRDIKNAM